MNCLAAPAQAKKCFYSISIPRTVIPRNARLRRTLKKNPISHKKKPACIQQAGGKSGKNRIV
jgi:hypothetical protein